MIRIIGGTLRGRKLEVPSGLKVRPSADRVREALFNMLDHRLHWQDFNVLDLYAGSG
ncbi:MAG: RsmD family RNA methyltransferase, partial [SAR324 cluster bacterium]|nr:RsmD family RNA methyltransferase [SAR324 cluster bacterium]